MPLLDDMKRWFEATLATLSAKSDTIKAIRYALNRCPALVYYCSDRCADIDNLIAERAHRGVAMGRSFCTSFRNLDKHWDLSFDIVATRAIFAR